MRLQRQATGKLTGYLHVPSGFKSNLCNNIKSKTESFERLLYCDVCDGRAATGVTIERKGKKPNGEPIQNLKTGVETAVRMKIAAQGSEVRYTLQIGGETLNVNWDMGEPYHITSLYAWMSYANAENAKKGIQSLTITYWKLISVS